MIFRTISDDADILTKRLGILNKSFYDIKKDFSNGIGIKDSLFKTGISEKDLTSLKSFNKAIKNTNDGLTKSQRITKAWNDNMGGCSITAKRLGNDLVTGKKKIQDINISMKSATLSTKALGVAMNIASNVTFILAVSAVTKVITKLAQSQSKAVESAQEATKAYKDEVKSIDDYKQKISELQTELNSGNLSYEDAKTKRSELMTIQDELIKKYGTEKSAIESITTAIDGQVDVLDSLNESQYREWLANADKQSIWNKLTPGAKSGLNQAINFMETDKTISIMDLQNANLSDDLQKIQKEIDDTIQSKYNLEKVFATFKVSGTPKEIKSTLESIRQDYIDLSKDSFIENGISSDLWEEYRKEAIDSINEVITKYDEGIQKHQETYQTYMEGKIKYDSDYSDEYEDILAKRANLEEAELSGDADAIAKARQEMMDVINAGIISAGDNDNVKRYFENLYPELQAEFAKWTFEFDLKTNTDNLGNEAKELGEKYSATDLLDMVNTEGTQDGEDAFNSLIDKAIEYGVCTDNSAEEVQKLIDLLVVLGIVQGEVQDSTLNNETPVSFSESFKNNLSALSDLQSLYADFKENAEEGVDFTFNYSDVDALREKFGDTCDSFEDFVRLATTVGTSEEEMQEAFNLLSTEYISQSGIIDTLTQANRDMIVSQLELQGITNASAIVTEELAQGFDDIKSSGKDLNTVLNGDSDALDHVAFSSDMAGTAVAYYMLAKITANGVVLNTDADIQNLIALMSYLGGATDALEIYSAMKSGQYTNGKKINPVGNSGDYYRDKMQEQIKSDVDAAKAKNSLADAMANLSNTNKKSSDKGSSKASETEKDIMAELNSEMDKYQSTLESVKDARETYNKYGKINQAQEILDADFKLLAAYGDEEAALESLGQAKLNEMQIQLARNAIDAVNNITSEAMATEYLAGANEHLVDSSLSATEAMLQQAVAAAKLRGVMQGQAADTILQGYQNGSMLLGQIDLGFKIPETNSDTKETEKEETREPSKETFNWIETLLKKLNRTTERLKESADKFVSWWRKNSALDKAIRANQKEVDGNQDAYTYYLKKASKVGLSKKYRKLVQDGSVRIEDISDEELAEKIKKYQEFWDKAQDCKDTIEELYDAEREMIDQKYDNMLEFYDTLDTKIQSVLSKVQSLMGLKEARGKQIDINDLLEKFKTYDEITGELDTNKPSSSTDSGNEETIEVGDSGIDFEEIDLADEMKDAVKQSALYKGLLSDIAKLEAKREKKGTLPKQDEAKLEAYYKKRQALEENATADTIVQYTKTYDAFMKLQAKLDKGKSLTKAERIRYDQYQAELDDFVKQRQNQMDDLQNELNNNPVKVTDPTESYEKRKEELQESYERQLADVNEDVRNTKQYKTLRAEIENLEAREKLTAKQEASLAKKRQELAALEQGATSENIGEYIKAYERFIKLSEKAKLTKKEQAEYDSLSAQLNNWNKAKQDTLHQLQEEMADALENLNSEQENAANDSAAEMAENQQKAYETAKKIAEIGASALQSELDVLDVYMSQMEKRLSLYQKFGIETLKKLGYVESDLDATQSELIMKEFQNYLDSTQDKRNKLLAQRDIYQKLVDAVNTHSYDEIKEMYEGGVFEQYGDTFEKVIELLKDNTFDGYSAEWINEWQEAISSIDQNVDDINISIQDLYDTMREEVTFRSINDTLKQLEYLKTELSNLSGLISDDIIYGEDGSLSDYGIGKAAVLIEQLENAQKAASEYREKYNQALKDDTFASEADKQEYLNNLKEQYSGELGEVKSFTEQLVSLYEKQKTSEINALKEIISKRKEALQAKKDYYDWDKNLKTKNKDIDALKAQIAAIENVNTAEAKAKLASLKAELSEKEDELNEMKEDHLYQMQSDALDKFTSWLDEDAETAAKSLEYQKQIVEKLAEMTDGYNIDELQSEFEKFYLGLLGNASVAETSSLALDEDNVTVPLESRFATGTTLPLLDLNIPVSSVLQSSTPNYEREVATQNNIDIHYDSMLRVDGNVDAAVVNDLKRHMEEQYNYTKDRMVSDLGKVGVFTRNV